MTRNHRLFAFVAVLLTAAMLLPACGTEREPAAAFTGSFACRDINPVLEIVVSDDSFCREVSADAVSLSGAFRDLIITEIERPAPDTVRLSTQGALNQSFSVGYAELAGSLTQSGTPLLAVTEIDMSVFVPSLALGGIEMLAKKEAKSLITAGIKKIPYVGNFAASALGPTLNDILGIKEGPSQMDVLKEVKGLIEELSLQLDAAAQDILNRLYLDQSFKTFDEELTHLASVTSDIYDRIAVIYRNTETSDAYKALMLAEILDFNGTDLNDYVTATKTLSKYLEGTQISNLNKKSILENAFYAACNDSVLGGEAAMRAASYVNQVCGVLSYSYKAMISILYSKSFVAENIADLQRDAANDPDLANALSAAVVTKYKDAFNRDYWESLLLDTDSSGIVALHDHYFSDGADSVVSQYNALVRKNWFSFIRNYKVSDTALTVEFVELNRKLACVKPTEIGLDRSAVKAATERVVNDVNGALKDTLYTSVSESEIKTIVNHLATNPYNVFLDEELDKNLLTTQESLLTILSDFGFDVGDATGKPLFICSSSGDYGKYSHYDTTTFQRHLGDDFEAELSVVAFDCAVESGYDTATGVAKEIPSWSKVKYYYYSKKYNSSSVKRDEGIDYTFYYFAPADTEINSKEDFSAFVSSVTDGNTYYNKTVYLNVDLDLDREVYAYIWLQDKTDKPFRGTFDGGGHTIRNLTDQSANSCGGLFRNLGDGANIKNLTLENITIRGADGKSGFGALAGSVTGNVRISNVTLASGSVSGGNCVGGLVGEVKNGSLVLTQGTNYAAVTATGNYAGGIVGACTSKKSQNLSRCANYGAVVAASGKAAGGIVGYLANDSADPSHTVISCTNSGVVETANGYTGGIIGHLDSDGCAQNISSNKNFAPVNAGSSIAGGIVGYSEGGGSFTGNKNEGAVIGAIAGGIMGKNEDDAITFSGSINAGKITAENQAGGVLGYTGTRDHDKSFCFDGSRNDGEVISAASHAGGIAAEIYSDGMDNRFADCVNTAAISGSRSSGGIVGKLEGGGSFTACVNTGVIRSGAADAAGVVGYLVDDRSSFTDCRNEASVTGFESAGGIAGEIGSKSEDDPMTFAGCTNSGAITSETLNAGGIAGMVKTDSTKHSFTDCSNSATVTGATTGGGIVGFMYGGGSVTKCVNTGNVTASDYVGGIFGRIEDDTCNFTDCENSGTLGGAGTHKGATCGYDGKRKTTY